MLARAIQLDLDEVLIAALADGWPKDGLLPGGWPPLLIAEALRSTKCLAALQAAGVSAEARGPVQIVSAKQTDGPIQLISSIPPEDPRDGYEVFPEQKVVAEFIIGSGGQPMFARIRESPDPRLGPVLLDVLPQWRFAPPRSQGEPVAVPVVLPVRFPASTERGLSTVDVDELPRLVKGVQPAFPDSELRTQTEGRVVLGCIIDREGRPRSIHVVSTTGEAFSDAAIAAFQQWIFTPAKRDGQPVPVRTQQPITFALQN